MDNPHTKAFPFWEWAIPEIKREHPDVILLAEAFTRPRMTQRLAKAGFTPGLYLLHLAEYEGGVQAYLRS